MILAKTNDTPVLFTPAEIPLEVAEPAKLAAEPIVFELKRAPIMAFKPTGEQVQLAEVVTAPPAEPEKVMTAERTLPTTASTLPLVGLLGLMTLGAAFALSLMSKRIQ